MRLDVTPLHPHFVGEVTGLDLRQPLDETQVAAIEAAIDRYAVLIFRDQPLTQTQQLALARSFGPLDMGLKKLKQSQERLEHAELADISNVADSSGRLAQRTDRKIVSNIANQLWHSDSSFQKPSARYSLLSAVRVPEQGGETEFADLRAAYDALPEAVRQEIEGLQAQHYALHSRFMLGDTDYTEAQKQAIPPAYWPLVRTHPGSGRQVLFISVHACAIDGWTLPEGRMLLIDLLEHATQPAFVYRHCWRPGDLVIWDNRCTLHRGRRFDFSQPRELRRATTLDA
ncbi:TauD/TfdA family dioxygenase [Halomonas sp. KM-1]|uniref:TauD/TfdA dioxygenase family protein n=1 Tax=Halomonas sp. KM-1 TaxID=590061 RepID=UPI000288D039|nr:TauD/TfdA family dioxygenase [Halomonas sp. KM-1]